MQFLWKTPNTLPSARTVGRIVDAKAALAQKQIGRVLKDKEDTTLYTDETRKYRKSIQTYIIADEDQTSYMLALREMFNKSGSNILETFKEIIGDVRVHCYQKDRSNEMDIGYQILADIRDTMSDRASSEKNFNRLLSAYREEVLPKIIDEWQQLETGEKRPCTKINNFFCGLHLLVSMVDSC
ncbi:hypothetical protein SNE40_013865 [Patella caerulea]|uniref:Uncharacterized protein n=1 Tax=Patella caerulea TaxID=87958 RepID=A0AAN8PHY0_PATCE